ncbi:hypothetical protein ABZY09_48725 [Streptomyces sp. NPDC002928]
MGTHVLNRPAAKKVYKELADREPKEAETVTQKITGEIVRNHRR